MAYTQPGRTRERVYRYVRARLLEGEPPTVREVQEAMGFGAVESARKQLDALVDEGRLVKTPGLARGYRLAELLHERGRTTRVPLLGRIQAGDLRAAIEAPEGHVVARTRFRSEDLFALRVQGTSMTGLGILDGDVVIVRRQTTAQSGEVIAALVGDEATVKTLRRRGRRIELHPANPDFEPIVPDPEDFRILGKVIELRRTFG
jgi:repressor LexA